MRKLTAKLGAVVMVGVLAYVFSSGWRRGLVGARGRW